MLLSLSLIQNIVKTLKELFKYGFKANSLVLAESYFEVKVGVFERKFEFIKGIVI